MWFNTITNCEMNDEDIRSLLDDIAHDNEEYFRPDGLIDDCHPAVSYYDVNFLVSDIIRKLDPTLYQMLWNEEIDYWIDETMYDIDRLCPNDGDTLNGYLDYFKDERLEKIVWRDEDEN